VAGLYEWPYMASNFIRLIVERYPLNNGSRRRAALWRAVGLPTDKRIEQ